MLESVTFILTNGQSKHLTFMSESGLQQFVREFRTLWETETGSQLEVRLKDYLVRRFFTNKDNSINQNTLKK